MVKEVMNYLREVFTLNHTIVSSFSRASTMTSKVLAFSYVSGSKIVLNYS